MKKEDEETEMMICKERALVVFPCGRVSRRTPSDSSPCLIHSLTKRSIRRPHSFDRPQPRRHSSCLIFFIPSHPTSLPPSSRPALGASALSLRAAVLSTVQEMP